MQPINEKVARNVKATNTATNFFIYFDLLRLFDKILLLNGKSIKEEKMRVKEKNRMAGKGVESVF